MAKDFNGTEITLGCTVTYPTRRGSNMWLSEGVVLGTRVNIDESNDAKVEVATEKGDRRVVWVPCGRTVVKASPQIANVIRNYCQAARDLRDRIERNMPIGLDTRTRLGTLLHDAQSLGYV